ncbi:MAG: elongation factor Ts [Micrococcales bacterium]|jgi:elongation factor Ts|nr:elongation factor Ts [Micrococcales bacterium]MDG1818136.1 translation elongation factor Ts [Aquiluna sp.]MBT5397923.1 elongation factor Ts [Micrococcales bacterium]MBT5431313.1 elongation factor Ts [Micrococcales bacterium]MBT5848180.1 elongation factor Ts [Micrococcales bacterium]
MANYTAQDVKALREKSGAGMMDCKGALDEANGDIEKAFEVLRLKGLKGVSKREGRTTSNGLVVSRISGETGLLIELACETDFVAKAENFVVLADQVADAISAAGATTVEEALAAPLDGATVADSITDKAAIMGEKVELRKVEVISAPGIDAYLHRTSKDLPPQVGVLLGYEGSDAETAHDIAVHIAAFSPVYLSREDVPEQVVTQEREIAAETARNEGKPEAALDKIVEGRVTGFFKETCLLDQAFAKDSKQSVAQVAKAAGLTITGFTRLRVGV